MSAEPTAPYARLLVLGDVHAEADAVRHVMSYAREHLTVDASLCVGDIVDGMGDADDTLVALREHGVVCVAGNHERWFLHDEMRHLKNVTPSLTAENRAMLEQLPRTLRLPTVAGGALLCHAVGDDDETFLRSTTRGYDLQINALRELMLDPDVDFMLAGHTHERMVRRFQGLVVVNAGTLRRDDDPGFVVVDFERMLVRCFDIADLGADIREVDSVPLPRPLPVPSLRDDDLY
ncbi:MAG: metallophosphoesterase [Polyangiales bacterium]|nr:metallophosphoesterase family protein [Myxococcales bacterium]MCB9662110.1 metallophosphoesterase family protein [Sandaracinaceae bacterium]